MDHAEGHEHHHSSKRHGSRTPVEHGPGFFKKYWVECTAILLFALGVFLLLEQMKIKAVLWHWLVVTFHGTVRFGQSAFAAIRELLTRVEVSDIVGICLIVAAVVILILGLRARAITRSLDLMEGADCPKDGCDGIVRRVRRTHLDRLVGYLLRVRVRPYTCPKCSSRNAVWTRRGES